LPAVAKSAAFAEPALESLRNISPAFDQPEPGSLFCRLNTRTIITPSAPSVVLAKLNWSALFQISDPPPVTVQLPLFSEAEPANAGEPMSASLQPGGKAPSAGFS